MHKCGNNYTQGLWSKYESSCYNINYLELLAIFFGLKCLCKSFNNLHIHILYDNVTAVSYINVQGGNSETLSELVKNIWLWCNAKNIHISAKYIPGKDNIYADRLSRDFLLQ